MGPNFHFLLYETSAVWEFPAEMSLNSNEITQLLKQNSDRVILSLNPSGRSEVWKVFRFISLDGNIQKGLCACKNCVSVLKCNTENGTKHLKRHQNSCLPFTISGKQPTISQSIPLKSNAEKITSADRLITRLKNAQAAVVVLDNHSFNSLEGKGLKQLLQQYVSMGASHGLFTVHLAHAEEGNHSGTLFGRKIITCHVSNYLVPKAIETLKQVLALLIKEDCISLTTDICTDSFTKESFLDVHAFWIDSDWKLKHCLLGVDHFGSGAHTGEQIRIKYLDKLGFFGISACRVPVTTDHGSNMVSGLRNEPRLDCMAHRTHTVLSTAWSKSLLESEDLRALDSIASEICNYVQKAAGIQEQLKNVLKTGSDTRPWTGLHSRHLAFADSYASLVPALIEKCKETLLSGFNRELNKELSQFLGSSQCFSRSYSQLLIQPFILWLQVII